MMKQTRIIMGMPITVEIVGGTDGALLADVFGYFEEVDARFSPYRADSELAAVNAGLPEDEWSDEMKEVLRLCDETRRATGGYFDVVPPLGTSDLDPSGLVKGWAINNAANKLLARGTRNFYIEAGGDIQTHGANSAGRPWRVGIRNPFDVQETIKTLGLSGQGIATSGAYVRGPHIYNPLRAGQELVEVKSITVVGPNIYEADRFATAAFAMGQAGIEFIEGVDGLEGYSVDQRGLATLTSGFGGFVYA